MARTMASKRLKTYLLAAAIGCLLATPTFGQNFAGPGNFLGPGLRAEQLPDPGNHLLREPLPIGDLQLFAPADITLYGGDPPPREGYFGSWEWLYWSMSAPEKDLIGEPGLVRIVNDQGRVRAQGSTFDTGNLQALWHSGQRFELGYVDGHYGWWVSGHRIKGHVQEFGRGDTDVAFVDQFIELDFFNNDPAAFPSFSFFPDTKKVGLMQGFVNQTPTVGADNDLDSDGIFGRFFDGNGDGVVDPNEPDDVLQPPFWDLDDVVNLPVTFNEVVIRNRTEMWGVEVMPFYRFDPTHRGAHIEMALGARFLRFDDDFDVATQGGFLVDPGADVGGFNGEGEFSPFPPITSFWATFARNDIIGPQLAARWFKTYGRLTAVVEGRYTAGFNFQRLRQEGTLGSNPLGLAQPSIGPRATQHNAFLRFKPISFNHEEREEEYSNIVELRVKADVQLTRSILFTVGYNGMWMDGIARSSNLVEYKLPVMGIDVNDNEQNVMLHGVNVGVVVNR